MSTYKTSRINYRKIYEKIYGSIPIDSNGVRYDIHHIDGNKDNNSIENLIALSIEDHYKVHYEQQDWNACLALSMRMPLTVEEKSTIATRTCIERVKNGTHPWLGGTQQSAMQQQKVIDGTHNFLGGELNRARIADGTHNFLGGDINRRRIEEGTHNFLDKKKASARNKKRVDEGTHHFLDGKKSQETQKRLVTEGKHHLLGGKIQRESSAKRLAEGTHQNLIVHTCDRCGKVGKGPVMFKHHFNNCKLTRSS